MGAPEQAFHACTLCDSGPPNQALQAHGPIDIGGTSTLPYVVIGLCVLSLVRRHMFRAPKPASQEQTAICEFEA
jgi:hypothetical protein